MTPITLDDQIKTIGDVLRIVRQQSHFTIPPGTDRQELVLESIINKLQHEKRKDHRQNV